MGGLCSCFISNPNEIIILDMEIEREKKRALKRSPISLEDNTRDIKTKQANMNKSNTFNQGKDQADPEEKRKDYYKQNSLDSTSIQKDIPNSLLAEFNEARSNPSQYSEKVLKYSNYIKSTNRGECYFEFNKQRIILDQGPLVFNECIEYLKEKEPIPKLKMSSELIINVPYEQINECDKSYYINKVISSKKEELKEKYSHLEFQMNKNVSNSEFSAIIQIIDPNDANQSSRKNIFNKRFSHVGINSFAIGDNVFCYYVLFGETKKEFDGDDEDL